MSAHKSHNYISLLKIEWLKIKNYRTFWVLAILSFISVIGISYISWYAQEQVINNAKGMGTVMFGSPFGFPDVWRTISWISGWITVLLGLLIIILTTNEYNFKTHRQNIIDGIDRMQFIGGKILLVSVLTLIFTVFTFLIALITGLIISASSFSFEGIEYIGYFFLQTLSYLYLALLFSVVFKRAGFAISLFILYALIIKNILGGVLNHYFDNVGNYLPLKSTDVLIPFPFIRRMMSQIVATPEPLPLLIMSFIYLFLYIVVCRRIYKRADL